MVRKINPMHAALHNMINLDNFLDFVEQEPMTGQLSDKELQGVHIYSTSGRGVTEVPTNKHLEPKWVSPRVVQIGRDIFLAVAASDEITIAVSPSAYRLAVNLYRFKKPFNLEFRTERYNAFAAWDRMRTTLNIVCAAIELSEYESN